MIKTAKVSSNNIQKYLDVLKMTKKELSDKTGISKWHLSLLISNKRKNVSLPIAMKVAKALKQPVEKVFSLGK